MKKLLLIMVPLLAIVFASGCGDPKVTGKVTFPDGTPLARGQVMFQKEGFVGSGNIQNDGSYSAGKLKDGDGLPPGQYQVFLTDTSTFGEIQNEAPSVGGLGSANARAFRMAPSVNLVHDKYMSPNTSGLTVNVTGATKYNITVEPPQ